MRSGVNCIAPMNSSDMACGEALDQRRLPEPRGPLQERVSVGEQGEEEELEHLGLTEEAGPDLGAERLQLAPQSVDPLLQLFHEGFVHGQRSRIALARAGSPWTVGQQRSEGSQGVLSARPV